jgi:hypothetical protein
MGYSRTTGTRYEPYDSTPSPRAGMTGRVRVLFAILVVFLVCYMDNKDRTWCKSTSYEITEADGGRSNTYIDL